ncbi:MAG: DNA repair protein RecO [Alphaproteobacteria bacterium]
MESFQDQGIVLSVRGHGENGAIVSLMCEHEGRVAGYVRGASGSKMRGTLEIGNRVDAGWSSRVSDGLGAYSLELCRNYTASFMSDPLKLAALQAACALVDRALPEREVHAGLYHGLCALFGMLQDAAMDEAWGQAYVMWEIALLKELGFSLDLSRCAGGGDDGDLAYVSPKTGRAVSRGAGAVYKAKLLPLPSFLTRRSGDAEEGDVLDGLKMTGYFLEHWVFNHHTHGVPEARVVLQARMG